jgi:curved DNA-binding protein CbpA
MIIKPIHPVFVCHRGLRLTACLHTSKDYYQVLGLNQTCTAKDIRSKYVELCKLYHPDTVTSGNTKEVELAKKKFQEVQEAYNTLSKESERRIYDDQRSMYSDHGSASSGWRQHAYRPQSSDDPNRDPYARAREYHRRRSQSQNNDTDGWSWGKYWEDSSNFWQEQERRDRADRKRDEQFYETQRQKWERERSEYSRYARDQQQRENSKFERLATVAVCILILMCGSLMNSTLIEYSEERFEEERARAIALAESRRRSRMLDMNNPYDRRYMELSAEDTARRFR